MSEQNVTPISERKLQANRANAKKSTGPRTQEGKERSRMNRLRHGLCAEIACIPGEDPQQYEEKRQAYAQFFQPSTQVELDLVNDLVQARWRMERYARHEAALLHATMEEIREQSANKYDLLCPDVEAALAFQHLVENSTALAALNRYEGRIRSGFNSAWRQLAALKKGQPPIPNPFPGPGTYLTDRSHSPNEPTAPAPGPGLDAQPAPRPPAEPVEPAASTQRIVVLKPNAAAPNEPTTPAQPTAKPAATTSNPVALKPSAPRPNEPTASPKREVSAAESESNRFLMARL